MISSTSTTSTSGVMLMAACILADSPSRIRRPSFFNWHSDVRHLDFRHLGLRYLEQAVDELRRRPIHLDMESLDLARKVVERDDSRDCDENTQSRRHQSFSDTARNDGHSA